jgi:hypothetical protein
MAYPEQPSYLRIGSSWKVIEQAFVYKSSAWKRVNQAYLYQGGAWKRVYAYDTIAPTILRFALTDTVSGQTYGSSKTTASYILEFSEPVTGWDDDMITISSNPGNAWEIESITTSDDTSYVVEISKSGTQTSGTVTLSVDPSGITDESEINAWAGSVTASESFSIDVTRPAVSEFASASASASRTVTFSLRFSESITGLIQSEFTIGGTSTGWQISSFSGSGSLYTIVLTETSLGSTTNGTLTLSIPQDSVVDAIGNTGPATTATSSTFTVSRTPVTPSVSAVSSTDLTLHNRRINYTVSVPAGLTTITHVYGYLYNENDVYVGEQAIDVTDTQSAFTANGSFDVGRNPGTKYYVRARTLNTASLYSEYSLRQEITTGGDRTPPVLAAPTVTANTPADPGVNTTVVRSLSYSFASPSSYLTDEVEKVNIYCIRSSDGAQVGTTEVLKGTGWGTTALTGTFGSLASSTNYYIYAKSTDIYGGTNSTANSSSTTRSTTATVTVQTGSLSYDWGAETNVDDKQTGEFTVTGNTFTQVSSVFSVPGYRTRNLTISPMVEGEETYKVTDVVVTAYVVIASLTLCTDSRYFRVDWSGAATSFPSSGQADTYNALQAPFNQAGKDVVREESAGFTLGYDNGGGGRIRVRGDGSIGTWSTNPDQRIRVRMIIKMKKKTWTKTDTRGSYSY